MNKRLLITAVVFVIVLTACSGESVPEVQVIEILETEAPAIVITEASAVTPEETVPAPAYPDPADTEPDTAEQTGGTVTLKIIPEETQARFLIDEVLFGETKTVVGTTNSVSGEIKVDADNPQNSQVNVQVDLRTLVTDNSKRNGAIQRFILETGVPGNESANFTATSITGLPEITSVGDTYEFQITGNLTVKGMTKEITFDVTATAVLDTRLEGTASAATLFTEFTNIPRLPPQVASVADGLILEIDFVAVAE